MGAFGNSNSVKVQRPSFRQKVLQDMTSITSGQSTSNSNPKLLSNIGSASAIAAGTTNVSMITNDGNLVATVGYSIVGGGDVIGIRRKITVGV